MFCLKNSSIKNYINVPNGSADQTGCSILMAANYATFDQI